MFKILFAINGKKHSTQALEFGGEVFGPLKATAEVVLVGKDDRKNRDTIKAGVKMLAKYKIKAKGRVIESGKIADMIIQEAETNGYKLLVMGSRSASGAIAGVSSYILGDVPRKVIEKCRLSTLIVKDPIGLNKVMLAVDGSKASEEAALFWGSLAKKHGKKWKKQKVNLLTVIPELYSQFSDELQLLNEEQLNSLSKVSNTYTKHAYKLEMDLAKKYRVVANIRLREGDVATEILKESGHDYGLIVLGRDELKGHTFGAHLAGIVEQADVPVMVIRRDAIKKVA